MPSASQMVSTPGSGLFAGPAASDPQSQAKPGAFIKRWRLTHIDPAYRAKMMSAASIAAEKTAGVPAVTPAIIDTFKLTLFDDATVTLYKTGMRQDSLGSTIWTGRVVDPEGGEATLVFRNGQIGGTVRLGNRVFMIEPSGADGTKIVETDPDQRPHANPLAVPAPPVTPQSAPSPPAVAAPAVEAGSAPTVINILVAYTPAAATAVSDIQSAISMGISYTNQVLSNSGINTQINLVGVTQVNYSENGNTGQMVLSDARSGVSGFAQVEAQRDALGADLVSVWAKFTDACGIAYQLDDADVNPTLTEAPYGYDAVSLGFGYACLTDGVAHEIGHNLGAAHDRYIDDPTDILTSRYNFGYVDTTDQIRTIMSYPDACATIGLSCAILPYHSSPSLAYQGHPLGIADSAPNSADNVRRINEIAPYIALFRLGGGTTHTVTVATVGAGTVTSVPSGISCGSICSATFPGGSSVTLTAVPAAGSTFSGWSGGGCSGTSTCTVNAGTDVTVNAIFLTPSATHTLSINLGTITGASITSNPPRTLSCSATCGVSLSTGTTVTLIAGAPAGSKFVGWSGACSGTGFCTVTMNSDVSVAANFATDPAQSFLVTVTKTGNGSGMLTTDDGAINCGSVCSANFVNNSTASITETPAVGSIFLGWNVSSCSPYSTICSFVISDDINVSASFSLIRPVTLSVAKAGSGIVSAAYSGGAEPIYCGTTCSASLSIGTQLHLNALANPGFTFVGWSGGGVCNGLLNCDFTLNADTALTATFVDNSRTSLLTIGKTGAGFGSVTSIAQAIAVTGNLSAISCGATCSVSFTQGVPITLTASAASGSTFVGWSGGGCSGDQHCIASMSADTTISANFAENSQTSITLAAATLPSSRSVEVGSSATFFATVINGGPGTATNCGVAAGPAYSPPPLTFQTTSAATNAPTGTPNSPVDIPAGGSQSFLLAFTPTVSFIPTDVPFSFSCTNASAAAIYSGVNTLLFSASNTPVADIVAIAGTTRNDGTLHIAGSAAAAAFVVAVSNVGVESTILAQADTGSTNLPLALTMCQTDQVTGACLSPPTRTISTTVGTNATASFGIFAASTGPIPFLPAVNRIFVRFFDPGITVRGSTSVAVRTQ